MHLFSKTGPRSSPSALAWERKYRVHPILEDFLGKRTPRCIGPKEPAETKSGRGRGGLFSAILRRKSDGSPRAQPTSSYSFNKACNRGSMGRFPRVIASLRDLTAASISRT